MLSGASNEESKNENQRGDTRHNRMYCKHICSFSLFVSRRLVLFGVIHEDLQTTCRDTEHERKLRIGVDFRENKFRCSEVESFEKNKGCDSPISVL